MKWEQRPLKDIGQWFGGGTPSKSRPEFWDNGSIPWLSPKDMGSPVLAGTEDHITPAAVAGSSVRPVPANSVAIVVRSGILERTLPVAIVPFETTLNQDMKALTPNDDVDARWIAWGLRAFESQLLRTTRKTGTTVASIEMPRLYTFELPFPSLTEQRRIVEILEDHLSRLDAAMEGLKLTRARLEVMRAALLSAARTGPSTPLPAVASIQGGIQKQQRRSPKENAYPFLRVANVTAHGLDLNDVHQIELFGNELSKLRLQPGDLLVVEGNGSPKQVGRAALWDGSIDDCVHQNHLIRVRPSLELLPEYLEAVWNSPETRAILTDVASSSSGLHTLSVSKLKALSIPVPSLDDQRLISSRLEDDRAARRRLLGAVETAGKRALQLRRAVLTAAFSGKLTGRHTDQEVIEELTDARASYSEPLVTA